MSAYTLVDGLGHIHAKVYASVGALPTPNLGALAIVDSGTGGQLYVSLHDVSGTLAWIEWSALYNAIVQNPTPGQNAINDTNTGDTGLSVTSLATAIVASTPETVLAMEQTGSTPPGAAVSLVRSTSTPAKPLVVVSPDGSTSHVPIDGYGSIAVDSYSTLPTPNTNRLGEIARVIAGGAGIDTFWYCGLSGGTPAWLDLQGPIGPTGPTGPAGPTGPTGPAGSFAIPSLPSVGGATLNFWMPCDGLGQMLPWKIPSGYTVTVVGGWGFWTATGTLEPIFASTYDGVSNTSWPSVVDSRFVVGRTLFLTYDSGGNNYLADGTHIYNDALVGLTLTEDTYIVVQPNVNATNLFGSIIWIEVQIEPLAAWSHTFDFSVSDGGWQPRGGDSTLSTWVSGSGWENSGGTGNACDTYIEFAALHNSTLTAFSATLVCTASPVGYQGCVNGIYDSSHTTFTTLLRNNSFAQSPGGTLNWTGSQVITAGEFISALADIHDPSTAGQAIWTTITVSGTGADPFV